MIKDPFFCFNQSVFDGLSQVKKKEAMLLKDPVMKQPGFHGFQISLGIAP